jgi:quercetin dioxygenase-like cupin family protein
MTEQVFQCALTDEKTIERVIEDEVLHINHMVLPEGEGFPEHIANAAVYMTVIRGRLSIDLDDQPTREYGNGTILKIPQGTRMRGQNRHGGALELLVVKLFTK